MRLLPFDSHNHVHMGPTPASQALFSPRNIAPEPVLSGMAIMSTHTRDFEEVGRLKLELSQQYSVDVVCAYGIHPWFLHELSPEDWRADGDTPVFVRKMEERLLSDPEAVVGEIGLDGFHFDPDTKELTTPMQQQVDAFEMQMKLASRLKRPVSIHAVQCYGSLMTSLAKLRKSKEGLPPKIYFHAFGGKEGTVDQLLALCGKDAGSVFFGFAPVINFRSQKTANVAKKVGIERLLLESDHEDSSFVSESIIDGIQFLSATFGKTEDEVIKITTKNAATFYDLQ